MSRTQSHPSRSATEARRLILTGRVQGVGFRPFVYRLAQRLGVRGWVQNRLGQVVIHAEADAATLDAFSRALQEEAPPLARPVPGKSARAPLQSFPGFEVQTSSTDTEACIHVPPDYDTCPDCLRELHDPRNRRYRYPFINCTQCGPRYTLITQLPYDRPNTSMAGFPLCPDCQAEYENPANRRFHAEPLACPVCGPQLQFIDSKADVADSDNALQSAAEALRAGRIVAVKGVGGYHLLCDATNDPAVARLRERKPRPHKPLAVMFMPLGADDLDAIRRVARLSDTEAACLRDPARPIVLVSATVDHGLSDQIAPGMNQFGVFLPYSPLHHLLLESVGRPLVATSANLSGEPVLTDNAEVQQRLSQVAEAFLHHNRPIVRPADDSVYRTIHAGPRPLRLGRGMAPRELDMPFRMPQPVLAVGGHMKNTIALAWEDRLVISPHIGDLDSSRSRTVFVQVIQDLQRLYNIRAEQVVCDAHPGYASHDWARQSGLPLQTVLHHHAHAAVLALEYGSIKPWLVFTWDGVGYGEGGQLWGGEALLGHPGQWQRVASFKPFYPPGGERAGREPWRSAAALCWEVGLDYAVPREPELVRTAWQKRLNSPATTAVGRLFDAAAALVGLIRVASFEGQGPMLLEAATSHSEDADPMPLTMNARNVLEADWSALPGWLADNSLSITDRANRFHACLASTLLAQAQTIRTQHGDFNVGLSGGVFQNKRLAETVIALLEGAGFKVYLPAQVPCNDGGLCAGQVMEIASTGS